MCKNLKGPDKHILRSLSGPFVSVIDLEIMNIRSYIGY